MTNPVITTFFAQCLIGASMLAGGCQSMPLLQGSQDAPTESGDITKAAPVTLDLAKGQVLQLALAKPREGAAAKASRETYYATALKLAEGYGDERLGMLRVSGTLVGEPRPQAAVFYAFPDTASQQEFETHPDWPAFKATRKDGWEELQVISVSLPEDVEMTFAPGKTYTVAAAWTDPAKVADYERYLDGIEADFDTIGARYMARFRDVGYASHSGEAGPSHMTFVEWTSPEGLRRLQASDAYKANQGYFANAVTRFDFYGLEVAPAL